MMWESIAKLLTETIPLEVRTRIVACSAFIGLFAAGWVAPHFFATQSSVDNIVQKISSFAQKSELQAVESEMNVSRAESDKNAILQLRQTECSLPAGQSKAIYTDTISARMQDYFKLTGSGFQLPECRDF